MATSSTSRVTTTAEHAGGEPAIAISHLRKTYGQAVAVDDVSFSVAEGEIFGILGPNGAGKTTTVECALGLRTPDSGMIRVLSLDPQTQREEMHPLVGAQLQSSALPPRLRVSEILELYRSFYYHPADVPELVDALGLRDKLHDYYKSLSGGQKQRLSIALALIGQPKIAVLDEMTTGLDPQARRDTWELIEGVRDRGVTIVLVTHYMDEAERLLTGLPEVRGVERQGRHVVVTGSGQLVNAVILALHAAGVEAVDVELGHTTLEDAFVRLTGHHPGHDNEEGHK